MSRQISATAIGAFVIGAITLTVIAVLLFTSGKFFARSYPLVAVFPGNVQGLRVGAAVQMRGVRIGSVTRIEVLLDVKNNTVTVPVFIEIETGMVKDLEFRKLEGHLSYREWGEKINRLIQSGLRAQLKLQSLVTGQLIVDFDFHPDTPARLTHLDANYVEVPTIATVTEKLMDELKGLPLQELAKKAIHTLDGIDRLVRSSDVSESAHNANLALVQIRQSLASVETKMNTALDDISRLTHNVDSRVGPLSKSADKTLQEARSALRSIDDLTGRDSATRAELDSALSETAKAARSLRVLANYLEQHPEALIKGKGY